MLLDWRILDFEYKPFVEIQTAMQAALDHAHEHPQLWMGEHPLVVSKGLRSRNEPIYYQGLTHVQATRGGQLTLHLPGQLVFYPIFKIEEFITIHSYIYLLEQIVIDFLANLNVEGKRCDGAPGVYTDRGKIASVGLRVSRGIVHHGLSFNITCPLRPFSWLVCCGQPNMSFTSLANYKLYPSLNFVKEYFIDRFFSLLVKGSK